MESNAKVRELAEQFCDRVRSEADALGATIWSIRAEPSGVTGRRCVSQLHQLSGTALCLGFDDLGERFAAVEQSLVRFINADPQSRPDLKTCVLSRWRACIRELRNLQVDDSRLLKPAQPCAGVERRGPKSRKEEADATALRPHRVLIVDDDSQIRSLVRNAIAYAGAVDVEMAISGEDALKKIDQFRPTLIISDWEMGPVDGLQLMNIIRSGKTRVSRDTMIVLLTKNGQRSNIDEAVKAGVDHFLVKPFSQNSLLSALRTLVSAEAAGAYA